MNRLVMLGAALAIVGGQGESARADRKKTCAAVGRAIENLLNKKVNDLLSKVRVSVNRSLRGIATARLDGRGPRLSAEATIRGNVVDVRIEFTRGYFEGKVDAPGSFFDFSVPKTYFPATAPRPIELSFTCAVETCKDFLNIEVQKTKIFPFIVDKINSELLAKLQTRFAVDDIRVTVTWPRIRAPRTNDKGQIVLAITDWGVEKVALTSGPSISVPEIKGASVALPCPLKDDPIDGECGKSGCPAPTPVPPDNRCHCGDEIPFHVEFASNDDDVSERYGSNAGQVSKIRECLGDIQRPCKLTLTGNTDCEGRLPGNQDLSKRRADGVKRWLEAGRLMGPFTRTTIPRKDDQPGYLNPINRACYSAVRKARIPMNQNCNEYAADGSFRRHLVDATTSCVRGNRRVDFKTEK
ncbi:MAG: hypothetical protein HYY84_12070 [Deltaproteobacteria bacterium]|nr:hypothetical protein [Deltaproteobacteria bacterium]